MKRIQKVKWLVATFPLAIAGLVAFNCGYVNASIALFVTWLIVYGLVARRVYRKKATVAE